MKVTAAMAIEDALARYQAEHPGVKPKRVLLGQYAYEMLHKEAKAQGTEAPLYPQNEDERLEYKGMKVCHHTSSVIEFEP